MDIIENGLKISARLDCIIPNNIVRAEETTVQEQLEGEIHSEYLTAYRSIPQIATGNQNSQHKNCTIATAICDYRSL